MKSFDDWYFELFESGNGSSLNQQEIAEEAWDFRQNEIDELQKLIDEALSCADKCTWNIALVELKKILRGDSHEC